MVVTSQSISFSLSSDIRTLEHVPGRSINLAMSVRGRTGLGAVGLEDQVIKNHGIPMRARMIHNTDGTTRAIPYNKDGQVGQMRYSVVAFSLVLQHLYKSCGCLCCTQANSDSHREVSLACIVTKLVCHI